MDRLIVFGVSGVGKTTACLGYVRRHPNYLLLSASSLIADATGVSPSELRTLSVPELMANQTLLQMAVESRLRQSRASNYILDGQCVLDNGHDVVTLSVDAIAPFRPTGLILLEAPALDIVIRRLSDARQRPLREMEELSTQLAMNRDAVESYATQLAIPFVFAEAKGAFSLDEPIAAISRSL